MADSHVKFRELGLRKKFLLAKDPSKNPDVYFKIPEVSVYAGYERVGSILLISSDDRFCILSSAQDGDKIVLINAVNLGNGLLARVDEKKEVQEIFC